MSDSPGCALTRARLEALYVKTEKPLFNVVYRWLWSREEAHDVVQDAFLKLWAMRERVREETVEPLVYRIALNLAANRRRSRKVWQWLALDTVLPWWGRPDDEADPARRQEEALTRAAVDGLPEPLRQVVVLAEMSGLTYAQVGEVLGIPEGTVGSRRNRALALLRERLGPLVHEEQAHDAA